MHNDVIAYIKTVYGKIFQLAVYKVGFTTDSHIYTYMYTSFIYMYVCTLVFVHNDIQSTSVTDLRSGKLFSVHIELALHITIIRTLHSTRVYTMLYRLY